MFKLLKRLLIFVYRKVNPIRAAKSEGVIIGDNCVIESFNFGSEPYLISLGNHVEISTNVSFITHDGATWVLREQADYKDVLRFGKIQIEDNVFIGHGAIILPNVTIGENTVIGAGSIVTKDIPANSIAAGNPARVISSYNRYAKKCLKETPNYNRMAYKKNKRKEILRFLNEEDETNKEDNVSDG